MASQHKSGPRTSRRRALCGALALALLAGLLHPAPTMAAGASPAASEDDEQAAHRNFAQGDAAYKAGRYDEALKQFEAGYAASKRPGFLLNMAHSARKLGQLREARALYKKYLLVDPTTKLRNEVRSLIGELDSALADEDRAERDHKDRDATNVAAPATPPPVATAVPNAPRPETIEPLLVLPSTEPSPAERQPPFSPFYRRRWFWIAVGAVVLTGVGAAIYASTRPGTAAFHDSGTLGSLGN